MSSAEPPLPEQPGLTADALLAGPRGRRLCWTRLWSAMPEPENSSPRWVGVWEAINAGDLSGRLSDLASCVALVAGTELAADEAALLRDFGSVVDTAQYWGEPDPEDTALGHGAAREALRPVAEAIAAAPATHWWAALIDPGHQRYAQFPGERPWPEPRLTGAGQSLAGWLADTSADERHARERPADPSAPYTGHWWSAPALSRLPVTTRALPALGAVRLALVEDGLGWQAARCWPVLPRADARVYEVHGPDQWADLVNRYPLDVSRSRRHDWWRVTGWAGRWLIPDYAAAAADWDAVHVSAAGYLSTAGIAIPAGDGARTMLAGWDPDATWWLTDVLSPAGSPEDWRADDQVPFGWVQASNRE